MMNGWISSTSGISTPRMTSWALHKAQDNAEQEKEDRQG